MGSKTDVASPSGESYEEECVRILRANFDSGINASVKARKKHLKQLKDLLTENEEIICNALSEDLGKCKFEAIAYEISHVLSEIDLAIDNLKSWTKPQNVNRYILQATDSAYTIQEPLGVVLIIGGWNFPVQLLLAPLVGALAAGNTALLMPSDIAASTSQILIDLTKKYFDQGVVKAIHANHEQSTKILKLRFDLIFFTGSTHVGQVVMKAAAEHLTPVILELGGKSPTVIDHDFDLSVAARRICWGKLISNGQISVAPDYVIVLGPAERRAEFTAECVKAITEFYGSDPLTSDDYGRIINKHHFKRLTDLLESTEGKVIYGGNLNESQLYIQPTVIEVSEKDSTMKDEIFGPILPVFSLHTLDDAIKMIRRHEKPLVSYLFSEDKKTIERFQTDVSCGTLTINDTVMHMGLDSLPFGGVGKSGMGRYHGKYSFEAFSHEKSVLHRTSGFEKLLWMRYPPFKNTDKLTWAQRLTMKIRLPLIAPRLFATY